MNMLSVAKWILAYTFPLALAAWVGYLLDSVHVPLSSMLGDLYSALGLRGVPYFFSWPITTMYLLVLGVPYVVGARLSAQVISQQRPVFSMANVGIAGILLVMSFPLTLLVLRGIFPFLLRVAPSWYSELLYVDSLLKTVLVGVPYLTVYLCLRYVYLHFRKTNVNSG